MVGAKFLTVAKRDDRSAKGEVYNDLCSDELSWRHCYDLILSLMWIQICAYINMYTYRYVPIKLVYTDIFANSVSGEQPTSNDTPVQQAKLGPDLGF